MDAITESWTTIPGHEQYEASIDGAVRSWKVQGSTRGATAKEPRQLNGKLWRGMVYYNLDGKDITLAEIMGRTFGPDADDDMLHVIGAYERELDAHAIEEIRTYEGMKDAIAVAIDFRVGPARVRRIWDGEE